MDKNQARKYAKETLVSLTTKDLQKEEKEIIKRLSENEHFLNAKKIGIYYPINKELNLLKLLELFPDKSFYFPKTINRTLNFHLIKDLTEFQLGPFNLKEPKPSTPIDNELDVYLVPCVATSKLYRIGHGAGFYDQYFENRKGYKIGIVHNQLKDLTVKMGGFDIPMDLIL